MSGAVLGGCSESFDTTRTAPARRGTVGEEVFQIMCERVDVGESPQDVDFARARPVCKGTVSPGADAGVGPRVGALAVRRPSLVDALDRTIPSALYERADALLVDLLPLYGPEDGDAGANATVRLADGGRAPAEDLLPRTTRGTATLLRALAADDAALSSLTRISAQRGYRPPAMGLGMTRALLGYPRLSELLEHTFALVREPEGERPAGGGYAAWNHLLDAIEGEMSAAGPAPAPDARLGTTLDATIDLLFRTDAALASGRPRWLARRDTMGMARIEGALAAPFADSDRDGMADANADGRFVGLDGLAIEVPTPFPVDAEGNDGPRDSDGRALRTEGGAPLYQSLDLDRTVLAALMRDTRQLVDPARSTALRLAEGASVLLGARAPASRDYHLRRPCASSRNPEGNCTVPAAAYPSFDPSTPAPLLDAAHAAGLALASPDLDPILATTQSLITTHESKLARTVAAMLAIQANADRHPEAVMDARSNLWDDVSEVLRQIAQVPGLLEAVLDALADPASAPLINIFGQYAAYKDRVEPVWTTAGQNASLAARRLAAQVDRGQPDTQNLRGGAGDNRSLLQRLFHLIHDLHTVRLCNKTGAYVRVNSVLRWPLTGGYARCEMFDIPDAAVLFLQSIAGTARIELKDDTLPAWLATRFPGGINSLLTENSGIDGYDLTPTPQALSRLVFQPDSLRTEFTRAQMDVVNTRDGLPARDVHPATIFAWEGYGFYAAMRPLARAFATHGTATDPDRGAHLFLDLVSAIHLHYASDRAGQYQRTNPRGALYSTMDGAVRYEAIVADAMRGDAGPAAYELVRALPSIALAGGKTGRDAIAQAVRLLFDPRALTALAYRDGRTTTVRSDGTTRVTSPNLYYLFADAMNGIDTAFVGHDREQGSWRAARSDLVDTFLAVDDGGTASAHFHNRALPAVGRAAIQWLRNRVTAHRAVGDIGQWARTTGSRLAESTQGPVAASIFDLLAAISADEAMRTELGQLLGYLLAEPSDTSGEDHFGATLTVSADLLQMLRADSEIDPLLHALSSGFTRRQPVADGFVLIEGIVPAALRFLDRAQRYDRGSVLDDVLANLVAPSAAARFGGEPLSLIGDAIGDVQRTLPGTTGPLDPADWRLVLGSVADFMADRTRGLEQFYYIVQHRRL